MRLNGEWITKTIAKTIDADDLLPVGALTHRPVRLMRASKLLALVMVRSAWLDFARADESAWPHHDSGRSNTFGRLVRAEITLTDRVKYTDSEMNLVFQVCAPSV